MVSPSRHHSTTVADRRYSRCGGAVTGRHSYLVRRPRADVVAIGIVRIAVSFQLETQDLQALAYPLHLGIGARDFRALDSSGARRPFPLRACLDDVAERLGVFVTV